MFTIHIFVGTLLILYQVLCFLKTPAVVPALVFK